MLPSRLHNKMLKRHSENPVSDAALNVQDRFEPTKHASSSKHCYDFLSVFEEVNLISEEKQRRFIFIND